MVVMSVIGIVLTGCATMGHLQTPSGRTEVFIEGGA